MPPTDVANAPAAVDTTSGARSEVGETLAADPQIGTEWSRSAALSADMADAGLVGNLELTDTALDVAAQQLHDAIDRNDTDAIHRILEPMSADDRKGIEQSYHDLFDPNGAPDTLRRDIQQKLDLTEAARDIAILDRTATITNDAGQLDYQLTRLADGDQDAIVGIREVLATLNPEQVAQLDLDLRTHYPDKYPNGLQSALFDNSNLSDQQKEALRILAKGVTNTDEGVPGRTAEDNIALANLALSMDDMNLLCEALRGNQPAAVRARAALQADAAFQQHASDTFGADNTVWRDFVAQGYISLTTIADKNNEGFFDVNRQNIELALANATLEERQKYVHGRELFMSGAMPAADSADAADMRFYQLTHDALIAASHNLPPVPTDVVNPPKTDPPVLDAVSQLIFDAQNAVSPQKIFIDFETLFADGETRMRFAALYGEDEDGYMAHGGTPENLERDKQLLEILKAASGSINASDNALQFLGPEYATAALLMEGKLSAAGMAMMNFPDSVIQQRLRSESPEQQQQDQQQIDQLYDAWNVDSNATRRDVTKWEDLLTRGGSIISVLADNHDDAAQVFATIENMSPVDWERLHSLQFRDSFLQEIDSALATYGVDEQTRAKAVELLQRKSEANSYPASLLVHGSILDSGTDAKNVVGNILNMSASEQQDYINNVDEFQTKVTQLLDGAELNDVQRAFVDRMLSLMRSAGSMPSYEMLSAPDRVLYDFATEANPYKTLRDIESMLEDPAMLAAMNDDQLLHPNYQGGFTEHADVSDPVNAALAAAIYGTMTNIVSQSDIALAGLDPLSLAFDDLLYDGKMDVGNEINLRFPPESIFPKLAALPPDEQQSQLDMMGLTDGQRQVFEVCLGQGGCMQLEDMIRSFIVSEGAQYRDPSAYSDFLDELQQLGPAELEALKSRYAEKYHADFNNDFLSRVEDKDYDVYKSLLTPEQGDGRQEYFDALGKLERTESGYIPEGPDLNAQRALELYAVALGDAQSGFTTLSPEDQAQFQTYFAQALEQLKQAQTEFAEQLISLGEKAVMFGAGLLAIAMSGGTLSLPVMAAIAAAGGAIDGAARVAVLKAIQGENFDGSVGNVMKEFFEGFAQGSLDTFAIVTLPGAIKGASELTAAVMENIANGVIALPEYSLQQLNALRSSLSRLISLKGTANITVEDLQRILVVDARVPAEEACESAVALLADIERQADIYEADIITQSIDDIAGGAVDDVLLPASDPAIANAATFQELVDNSADAWLRASVSGEPNAEAAIANEIKAKFLYLTQDPHSGVKLSDVQEFIAAHADFMQNDPAIKSRLGELARFEIMNNPEVLKDSSALTLIQSAYFEAPAAEQINIQMEVTAQLKLMALRGDDVTQLREIGGTFTLGSEAIAEIDAAHAAFEAAQKSPELLALEQKYLQFRSNYKGGGMDPKKFEDMLNELGLVKVQTAGTGTHYVIYDPGPPQQFIARTWMSHEENSRYYSERAVNQFFTGFEQYLTA